MTAVRKTPSEEVSVQPVNPTEVPGYDSTGFRPETARPSPPVGKHMFPSGFGRYVGFPFQRNLPHDTRVYSAYPIYCVSDSRLLSLLRFEMPFHVSAHSYLSGDLITMGWFGKNLTNEPNDAQIREYFYEIARLEFSPNSPSRLRSCFFFDTRVDAQMFQNNFRGGHGTIYQVKLSNPNAAVHRHCVSAHHIPAYNSAKILDAHASIGYACNFWMNPAIYSNNTESFAESDLIVL